MLRFFRWLQRLFGITPKYRLRKCDEIPDSLDQYTLYVVGSEGCYWLAAMTCPCECGDLIQLSLASSGHPRWTIDWEVQVAASLYPSVHRTTGCRSHFFLKQGKVIWCNG